MQPPGAERSIRCDAGCCCLDLEELPVLSEFSATHGSGPRDRRQVFASSPSPWWVERAHINPTPLSFKGNILHSPNFPRRGLGGAMKGHVQSVVTAWVRGSQASGSVNPKMSEKYSGRQDGHQKAFRGS